MNEFDLKSIFRSAFGYEAPAEFTIEKAEARKIKSELGQPYYNDVVDDLSGREYFMPVWLNGVLIPFAVVGMTWKKTFVTTSMPERGGSVHEQISIDDYVFNIKGLLVDDSGAFPEKEIIKLHELFKINASVQMRSALSAIVLRDGEEKVIIKEIKWPPSAGSEHVKAFEIDCESDQIFELVIP